MEFKCYYSTYIAKIYAEFKFALTLLINLFNIKTNAGEKKTSSCVYRMRFFLFEKNA